MTDQTPEPEVPTYGFRQPSEPSIGTRSPSVILPRDRAIRDLKAVTEIAVASGVTLAGIFDAVLAGANGVHLGGQRRTLEAHVFAAIADADPSPLDGMILKPGQSYDDRGDYAVLSVTRHKDPVEIAVEVVP